MSAVETVRDYYEALRRGEPLYPYFVEDEAVVKFGVGETLSGYEAVAEGLREQSRDTEAWTVESQDLTVLERDAHATFADHVHMAWTDTSIGTDDETNTGTDYDVDTRWSGTLERRGEEWLFAGMHVSVAWDGRSTDDGDGRLTDDGNGRLTDERTTGGDEGGPA